MAALLQRRNHPLKLANRPGAIQDNAWPAAGIHIASQLAHLAKPLHLMWLIVAEIGVAAFLGNLKKFLSIHD